MPCRLAATCLSMTAPPSSAVNRWSRPRRTTTKVARSRTCSVPRRRSPASSTALSWSNPAWSRARYGGPKLRMAVRLPKWTRSAGSGGSLKRCDVYAPFATGPDIAGPCTTPEPGTWALSCCCCLLGEADVQDEVSEPQVQDSAACPVHDECQQDDGEDDDHQPEEEHDDSGDSVPGYCSGSSHGLQLPGAARIIRNWR